MVLYVQIEPSYKGFSVREFGSKVATKVVTSTFSLLSKGVTKGLSVLGFWGSSASATTNNAKETDTTKSTDKDKEKTLDDSTQSDDGFITPDEYEFANNERKKERERERERDRDRDRDTDTDEEESEQEEEQQQAYRYTSGWDTGSHPEQVQYRKVRSVLYTCIII